MCAMAFNFAKVYSEWRDRLIWARKSSFSEDSPPPQSANLATLPNEILWEIVSSMDLRAICSFSATSRAARLLVDSFVSSNLKYKWINDQFRRCPTDQLQVQTRYLCKFLYAFFLPSIICATRIAGTLLNKHLGEKRECIDAYIELFKHVSCFAISCVLQAEYTICIVLLLLDARKGAERPHAVFTRAGEAQ